MEIDEEQSDIDQQVGQIKEEDGESRSRNNSDNVNKDLGDGEE